MKYVRFIVYSVAPRCSCVWWICKLNCTRRWVTSQIICNTVKWTKEWQKHTIFEGEHWKFKTAAYDFFAAFVLKTNLLSIAECDVPVPGIPVPGNCSFFDGIRTGIEKIWYRKSPGTSLEKIWYRKSPGTGLGKFWYRKKVLESVSFRFWVSSHTAAK